MRLDVWIWTISVFYDDNDDGGDLDDDDNDDDDDAGCGIVGRREGGSPLYHASDEGESC